MTTKDRTEMLARVAKFNRLNEELSDVQEVLDALRTISGNISELRDVKSFKLCSGMLIDVGSLNLTSYDVRQMLEPRAIVMRDDLLKAINEL